jgi:hypothetical protein
MNLDDVAEDVRLPEGKSHNGMSLHYYAGVNSVLGVVIFVWVTGTTGLRKNLLTQVCPALPIVATMMLCCYLRLQPGAFLDLCVHLMFAQRV